MIYTAGILKRKDHSTNKCSLLFVIFVWLTENTQSFFAQKFRQFNFNFYKATYICMYIFLLSTFETTAKWIFERSFLAHLVLIARSKKSLLSISKLSIKNGSSLNVSRSVYRVGWSRVEWGVAYTHMGHTVSPKMGVLQYKIGQTVSPLSTTVQHVHIV